MTHVFPYYEVEKAFQMIREHPREVLKAALSNNDFTENLKIIHGFISRFFL